MTEETNPGGLTAEEQAYFDSEGETPLPDTPDTDEVQLDSEDGGGTSEEDAARQQEGAGGERQRDENGRFVPHGAFHAEREERKKAEAEAAELREFKARMEERMRWAQEMASQQQQQQEGPKTLQEELDALGPQPDKNIDVFASMEWQDKKNEILSRHLTQLDQSRRQEEEQYQNEERQLQHMQRLSGFIQNSANEFAKQTPDYWDAAEFLQAEGDKRLKALSVANPQLRDPEVRKQHLTVEALRIAETAAQMGRHPAELFYEMATDLGWTPDMAKKADNAAAEKLQGIEKAQNGSRTVGAAAGKSGGDDITIDTLSNMPQDEFNAFMATKEGQATWKRLMGG